MYELHNSLIKTLSHGKKQFESLNSFSKHVVLKKIRCLLFHAPYFTHISGYVSPNTRIMQFNKKLHNLHFLKFCLLMLILHMADGVRSCVTRCDVMISNDTSRPETAASTQEEDGRQRIHSSVFSWDQFWRKQESKVGWVDLDEWLFWAFLVADLLSQPDEVLHVEGYH